MNESALIHLLTKDWSCDRTVLTGVGDDCAVIRGTEKEHYKLFKTDSVVEGRHFTRTTSPSLIGRKALARVLSDFAAMGGVPRYAVVTLGLPDNFLLKTIRAVYAGLTRLAKQHQVNLVGGETTRSHDFFLNVAAIGETKGYKPVRRSTARAGDLLMVTGTLGGTQKRKHLVFDPRLAEGAFLARKRFATAMMDLSDGLGSDLPRLCEASGLIAQLDLESLPRSKGVSVNQACSDGEDYELLFTISSKNVAALQKSWPFPTRLTAIGRLLAASPSQTPTLLPHGYDHLR